MKRRNLYPLSILAILAMLFTHFGFAQNTPMLVRDIVQGSASSNPTKFVTLGTKLYFTASTGAYNQLYQTDGTANGTVVVAGYDADNGLLVNSPVVLNGQLYFVVQRTSRQNQGTTMLLYKTNSTTAVLVDTLINNAVPPSSTSVSVINLRVQNNLLYYEVKTDLFNQSNTGLVLHTGQAGGKKVLGIIESSSSLSGTVSSNVTAVFIGNSYVYLFGESSSSTSGFVNRGRTISVININEAVPTPRVLSPYTVNYGSVPPAVAAYRGLGELGNEGYFTRNDTLFSVDIRGVGKILKVGVGQPNSVQKVGNFLYFTNNNNQIWRVGGSIVEVVQINTTSLQPNEIMGTLHTDGTEVYVRTQTIGVFPAFRRIVGNTLTINGLGVGFEASMSEPYFANGKIYAVQTPNIPCVQTLVEYDPTANQNKSYPILEQANCNSGNQFGGNFTITPNNLLFYDLMTNATGKELWKIDLTPSVPLPNLKSGGWLFRNEQSITGLSSAPNVFVKGYDSFTPLAGSVQGMNLSTTAINPKLRLYISADNTIDANDFVFTTKTLRIAPNVGPNEYFSEGASDIVGATLNQIPANFPEGDYKLIAKIDADNEIAENNENDNIDIGTVSIVGSKYCASKGTLPWEYWISNVKLGSINNTSDKFKDFNTLGYSDYTNLTTSLGKGQSYPLSISPGLSWIGNVPNVYARAWIDFNNNNIFETNELVLEKTNANPLISNVLVPTTAVTGNVRMRVSVKFGSYPTACEAFDKGEVEDYTVQIMEGVSNQPDLTLSNLIIPSFTVQQGQILDWKVDMKNIGTAAAQGNIVVKGYISTDNLLSTNDLQIGSISTVNYPAGFVQNQAQGGSFITNTLAIGQYYLIVKIDADDLFIEGNENNNILVSPMPFTLTPLQSGAYCTSKGSAPWELWTSNVKIGTINNTSEKFKDFATLGYSDYTNLTTTLSKGQSYPLSISPALSWIGNLPNVYARVWIDFNNNKIFEANELVLENTNANPLISNVLVPITAVTGNVRMRVSMKWGAYPTACETFGRGEVEDYTINIQDATSGCDNVTSGGEITGNEDQCAQQACKFCPGNGYTATTILNKTSATGGTGALEYIWVKNTANTPAEGITIAGATLDSLDKLSDAAISSKYLTSTTYFKRFARRVGCTNYVASNGISKIVRPITVPVLVCPNDTIITLTGVDTCYRPSLPSARFITTSSCDLRINGVNEDRRGRCLNVGINPIKWTGLFENGAFTTCSYNVTVVKQTTTSGGDIALSITSTPSVFQKYTTQIFKIKAQNVGSQALTNVKIEFKRPAQTSNGGAKVASVGTFSDFCPGGIECSEWTIPSLAAGATATLDAPVFILDPTTAIVATTKLLSSTPVDGNAANNSASVTLTPAAAPAIQALSRKKPTQYIPIIVQSIAPNPTEGDVVIEVESLKEQIVQFDFSNTMGQVIRTEKRPLEKGSNQVKFDVYAFPDGVYLIQTDVNRGRFTPTKFVKF